jgi:hypothetical protein
MQPQICEQTTETRKHGCNRIRTDNEFNTKHPQTQQNTPSSSLPRSGPAIACRFFIGHDFFGANSFAPFCLSECRRGMPAATLLGPLADDLPLAAEDEDEETGTVMHSA